MMQPKVFISFASEDDDARLELGRELARQGIEAYDYSIPHEGSQVGMRLEEQIAAEIESADLFISLISDASTSAHKTVVHREVAHALERTSLLGRDRLIGVVIHAKAENGKARSPRYYHCLPRFRLRDIFAGSNEETIEMERSAGRGGNEPVEPVICRVSRGGGRLGRQEIPALLCGDQVCFNTENWHRLVEWVSPFLRELLKPAHIRSWLGSFSRIQDRAWTHVDLVGPGCFNSLGKLVCERLGIAFQRPAPEDSRLPLYAKLQAEIWDLPNHVRETVLGQMDYFTSRLPVGSWQEALTHLGALRNVLIQHHRDSYYARVIEGLCLLRLGRPGEAKAIFDRLIDAREKELDENAWSGRAKASFALGQYGEALASAREAVTLCRRKSDPAPHARQDWITLAVEGRRREGRGDPLFDREWSLAIAEAERFFGAEAGPLGVDEALKRRKLKAHYLWLQGRESEALVEFERIVSDPITEVEISEGGLSGFPNDLGSAFYAALADVGIFIDSPTDQGRKERVAVMGNVNQFWLREGDAAHRFERVGDNRYRLNYIDLDVLTARHRLRWKLNADRDWERRAWLDECEAILPVMMNPHLAHLIMENWVELGDGDRAIDLVDRALGWFPNDPQIHLDAAYLYGEVGERWRAFQEIDHALSITRKSILSATAQGPWELRDLIEFWATAKEWQGNLSAATAARELLEE